MPSPIGHGLASLIIGRPASWRWVAVFAAVGLAPDLDLIWGRHSMETHSIGAAAIAGLAAVFFSRDRRVAVIVGLVWLAHPLMDALGDDSSIPRGVMLLWPFSREFYIAPITIFDSAYRAYWKPDFWPHNIVAVAKEVAILMPIAAIVWWRRRNART